MCSEKLSSILNEVVILEKSTLANVEVKTIAQSLIQTKYLKQALQIAQIRSAFALAFTFSNTKMTFSTSGFWNNNLTERKKIETPRFLPATGETLTLHVSPPSWRKNSEQNQIFLSSVRQQLLPSFIIFFATQYLLCTENDTCE